jgi:cytochrome c-type biogenesis protein CcmE
VAVEVDGAGPVPAAPRVRPRSRNARRLWIAGAFIVIVLGFLVFRGLGNATLYFRTADEAVAKRDQLGTRRFRIEGTVVQGSVRERGDALDFRIESKGTVVDVVHRGNQPGLFKPGIPVVLEGRFAGRGETFNSDRILVKHSETYVAKNPGRVTTTVPAP